MSERPVRLLVVDDHEVVQWGLRLLLERQPWVERCLTARNGREAIAMAAEHEPDLVIVDLLLAGESGAQVCADLRELAPAPRVLLISGAGRLSQRAAVDAGACGFVFKDWEAADVVGAVRMAARGMTVFPPDEQPASAVSLSSRELDVLSLIATGATNRLIAERLHLSPHTVKEHASAIYGKLGVRNRAEAVNEATRLGLIA